MRVAGQREANSFEWRRGHRNAVLCGWGGGGCAGTVVSTPPWFSPVLQTQHRCHCQRIRAHPVSHASPTPFPRLHLLPQARLVCQRRHQRAVRAIVGTELVVLARRVAREVGAVRERALVVGLHKVRCRVARALHGVAELGQPVRLPRRRLCPRLRLALARLHLLQPQLGLLHPEAGGAPDPGEFTPERRGREGVQRGRTAGRRPTTKGG